MRIVPVDTGIFANHLHNARISRREEWEASANDLTATIIKSLNAPEKGYIFNNSSNNLKIEIDEDKLKKAILKTFLNSTIPAMYINMENGFVYLDKTKIGGIKDSITGTHVVRGLLVSAMVCEFLNDIRNKDFI